MVCNNQLVYALCSLLFWDVRLGPHKPHGLVGGDKRKKYILDR